MWVHLKCIDRLLLWLLSCPSLVCIWHVQLSCSSSSPAARGHVCVTAYMCGAAGQTELWPLLNSCLEAVCHYFLLSTLSAILNADKSPALSCSAVVFSPCIYRIITCPDSAYQLTCVWRSPGSDSTQVAHGWDWAEAAGRAGAQGQSVLPTWWLQSTGSLAQ